MSNASPAFEELIARCIASNRDHAAWNELFRRFNPFVYHWAAVYLARSSRRHAGGNDARDLAMEVWTKLLRNERTALRDFKGRSELAFQAYLRSILHYRVIDLSRRAQAKGRDSVRLVEPEELMQLEDPSQRSSPLRQVMAMDLAEKAKAHLCEVWRHKESCSRDVLIYCLHIEDGYSAARIAAIGSVGLTRGGVEKVIDRIRDCLKDLADEGEAEASA